MKIWKLYVLVFMNLESLDLISNLGEKDFRFGDELRFKI